LTPIPNVTSVRRTTACVVGSGCTSTYPWTGATWRTWSVRPTIRWRCQQDVHVVDVGVGRAGLDELAERIEERVTIVIGQRFVGVSLLLCCSCQCLAGHPGACRVGGPVVAVGADAGQQHARHVLQLECRC